MRERTASALRLSAPMRAAAQRLALPLLIIFSAFLAVLGRADLLLADHLRVAAIEVLTPILQVIAQPVGTVAQGVARIEDMVGIYGQNARLREENARLLHWEEAARRLAAENAGLRKLTRLVPENTASYVSARVIADAGGAFARSVLVNAGAADGVARGQAALSGEGLVGRVAEVGARGARVLLLTDLNSRVPVVLERSSERAVLAGDNTDRPRLLYLPPRTQVKPGDRILTGGSGGIFPPGLPVGVVASVDPDVVRVEPYAELSRLDYLRIVDFGLAGVLPQSAVPPPRAIRAGRGSGEAAAR